MLFTCLKKIQDGRHDFIIADVSKWFNLLEILYKYSPGVHTHTILFSIVLEMQYGRFGGHFGIIPNICDDYSSRTTSGRYIGFSSKGSA